MQSKLVECSGVLVCNCCFFYSSLSTGEHLLCFLASYMSVKCVIVLNYLSLSLFIYLLVHKRQWFPSIHLNKIGRNSTMVGINVLFSMILMASTSAIKLQEENFLPLWHISLARRFGNVWEKFSAARAKMSLMMITGRQISGKTLFVWRSKHR